MDIPDHYLYTPFHHWIHWTDQHILVGITPAALPDAQQPVHVEIAHIGRRIDEGRELAMIETSKTSFQIDVPVTCRVLETNSELLRAPAFLVHAPFQAWIARLEPCAPPSMPFLDAHAYRSQFSPPAPRASQCP